jgi:DNA-binding transcriptional LysR family regulator
MPRLPSFAADFDLDVVTVPMSPVFFEDTNLDAVIAGSDYEPRPELAATEFMEDGFGPVAAPDVAAALGVGEEPAALARAVAISARPSPDLWDNWFHESGVTPVRFRRRIELDSLMLCLRAAAAGLGVAMAPRATAEADILSGHLVAPYGFILRRIGYRNVGFLRNCGRGRLKQPLNPTRPAFLRSRIQGRGQSQTGCLSGTGQCSRAVASALLL